MPKPLKRRTRLFAAAFLILLAGTAAGWWQGFAAAAAAWALLGISLALWLVIQRVREQDEVIRNLSGAIEHCPSAVLIVDVDDRIEYANSTLCVQTGYARRELIGRLWRDLFIADLLSESVADLVASQRAGQSWKGEWNNKRKDGAVYPVRGVVSPVRRRNGELECTVAIFDDTTDARKSEAEFRLARERAEEGDRAKSQFLGTMSHEVRTPLNGIVGFTGLLLDMELAPEPREYVEAIRSSSEILIQLTGDILDFARIESGKLKLDPRPCDPRECLEGALDLLAAPAMAKNLELLHWVEEGVPAKIVADSGRLRQVLVNLVNNAVKFTAAGEIEVTLKRVSLEGARKTDARYSRSPFAIDPFEPSAPDACVLEFSVRDTGIGIPASEHHRLFQPFSQVEDPLMRNIGGTGLGLAISKTIVQMMGGRISVASEPGRGSTFTFTMHVPVSPSSTAEESALTLRPLANRRMALVTAAPGMARELRRLGARWGAEIVEVDYPALTGADYDVALVDLDDVLVQKLSGPLPNTRVASPEKQIGLVSHFLPGPRRQRMRRHFRALVNKPLHHISLLRLLADLPASPARIPSTPPMETTATADSLQLTAYSSKPGTMPPVEPRAGTDRSRTIARPPSPPESAPPPLASEPIELADVSSRPGAQKELELTPKQPEVEATAPPEDPRTPQLDKVQLKVQVLEWVPAPAQVELPAPTEEPKTELATPVSTEAPSPRLPEQSPPEASPMNAGIEADSSQLTADRSPLAADSSKSEAPPPPPAPTHFPMRVLLVEDNAVNQRLMQAVLTNLGCRYTLAANGRLALQELPLDRYELILMDIHMPEMDGLTATKKIRAGAAGAAYKDVWIVALTADDRSDQQKRIAEAGANEYLGKPLKRVELQVVLEKLTKRLAEAKARKKK